MSNERRPLVTVLMALYNGGEYLKQSVRSVLTQTYADFEFLIIDDCSTDNSVETVRSFQDPRIRIITNEKNVGQTKSLNVGLREARGKYAARIDADDVALPNWLEAQVKFVQDNPQYSVVSAYGLVIDEKNRLHKSYNTPSESDDIILRAVVHSPINHVVSLIKVEDALKVGGYTENYRIAADYDLWRKLLHQGYQLTTNPVPLAAIRVHGASLSHVERNTSNISEIASVIRDHVAFISNYPADEKEIKLLCDANYNESTISYGSFLESLVVLDHVYAGIKQDVVKDINKINLWHRIQRKTIILKRIYAFIVLKDYREVRDAAREGVKNFGWISGFGLIYSLTFLGNLAVAFIPFVYQLNRRIEALGMNKFRRQINVTGAL